MTRLEWALSCKHPKPLESRETLSTLHHEGPPSPPHREEVNKSKAKSRQFPLLSPFPKERKTVEKERRSETKFFTPKKNPPQEKRGRKAKEGTTKKYNGPSIPPRQTPDNKTLTHFLPSGRAEEKGPAPEPARQDRNPSSLYRTVRDRHKIATIKQEPLFPPLQEEAVSLKPWRRSRRHRRHLFSFFLSPPLLF